MEKNLSLFLVPVSAFFYGLLNFQFVFVSDLASHRGKQFMEEGLFGFPVRRVRAHVCNYVGNFKQLRGAASDIWSGI